MLLAVLQGVSLVVKKYGCFFPAAKSSKKIFRGLGLEVSKKHWNSEYNFQHAYPEIILKGRVYLILNAAFSKYHRN